jgi:hypothetical protein
MSHLSNFCGEKAHSRQQINDAPFERETSNDKIGIAEVIPGSALQLPSSFRLTDNPHLTTGCSDRSRHAAANHRDLAIETASNS